MFHVSSKSCEIYFKSQKWEMYLIMNFHMETIYVQNEILSFLVESRDLTGLWEMTSCRYFVSMGSLNQCNPQS